MDYKTSAGLYPPGESNEVQTEQLIRYINLKLAALGQPIYGLENESDFIELSKPLIQNLQENLRKAEGRHCPVDTRIQNFLNDMLEGVSKKPMPQLPHQSFVLDRYGLARMMSLPPDKDTFISDIVCSYRVKQGVLHNPKNDRRTTQNSFHVVEGGMPIADDKLELPRQAFKVMLEKAFSPSKELLTLPFTSTQQKKAYTFVSLYLRPIVLPEVRGVFSEKRTEIRFFAPASLVSNLDFVESIFGNAGDPYLAENDAALDIEHWTGHTGCVVLAPQLTQLTKKELGLPHYDKATERQREHGMCWKKEKELYNGGEAFKVTCRDARGVMVTLIADNYFGYCKKEVKTQIGFSANLFGLAEEEHSGGAIAFQSYDLGEGTHPDNTKPWTKMSFKEMHSKYGALMEMKPEGYGVDKVWSDILYVPEDASFNLREQKVSWSSGKKTTSIKLLHGRTYVLPSGYKIHMEMQGSRWKLIGTVALGTVCHKPCTVSGGGKSEISKSIRDAMIQGPIFTANFDEDMKAVEKILAHDFGDRFRNKFQKTRKSRPILSSERSLGSTIKLFTPSPEYTDAHNAWITKIPRHVLEIVYIVKRLYKPQSGKNWKEHFSVDLVNNHPHYELKYKDQKLVANYLRVGQQPNGAWRIFKLRPDFNAAEKIQTEDDITSSVVISKNQVKYLNPEHDFPSFKIVQNCEYRLFQRPDDAIYRGYDKQAEADLSSPNTFLSNYEPLTLKDAKEILDDAIGFNQYTKPVQKLIAEFAQHEEKGFFVSSSHPRMIDGKPCKNPRYLQNRPDLMNPRAKYLAEVGERLYREVPLDKPVYFYVSAVLAGRRMNPPDRKAGIPPLAIYNPIHYQELPELFMDFICSVTGKSPSTTGFGSEGALTKGPFNAIWTTADLNNAIVSYILTDYPGFSSQAGHIGPNVKVDHDISLLIPEIWCRMRNEERKPEYLIKNNFLERLEDFKFNGKKVLASRLGYRINLQFVNTFLGRIFNNPYEVFSDEMLRPEKQDPALFAEGMENLVKTQQAAAQRYFEDGSIESACPPLKALLHIMAKGNYEGKDVNHSSVRALFDREAMLKSKWYQERLKTQQDRDTARLERNIAYVSEHLKKEGSFEPHLTEDLRAKLEECKKQLKHVKSAAYLEFLKGTLGADPLKNQTA